MHQEAYDKAEGLRRSDLWKIHRSPYYFKTQMEQKDKAPSAALTFGIAAHKLILEPTTFFDEYAIAPEVNRRTKAGKEEWENFVQQCAADDKEAISQADYNTISMMADAVRKNPLALQFLTGIHESEWYWTDPSTQEKLKCKCDNITDPIEGKKYIVDYKTTDSCENGHFERSVSRYGYQFQAGFYTEGLKQNTGEDYGFAFVAQEKSAPYACRIYICSDIFVINGQQEYFRLLNLYHSCKESGDWYGYEGETPKPTMLLDITEWKAQQQTSKTAHAVSGFNTDDYLDDPEDI